MIFNKVGRRWRTLLNTRPFYLSWCSRLERSGRIGCFELSWIVLRIICVCLSYTQLLNEWTGGPNAEYSFISSDGMILMAEYWEPHAKESQDDPRATCRVSIDSSHSRLPAYQPSSESAFRSYQAKKDVKSSLYTPQRQATKVYLSQGAGVTACVNLRLKNCLFIGFEKIPKITSLMVTPAVYSSSSCVVQECSTRFQPLHLLLTDLDHPKVTIWTVLWLQKNGSCSYLKSSLVFTTLPFLRTTLTPK